MILTSVRSERQVALRGSKHCLVDVSISAVYSLHAGYLSGATDN